MYVYDVKSTSQPDTIALLGNNFRLQIIETGFAEQFYASHWMGPATIYSKISLRIAERETYRMIPLKTRLFAHWSIPLRKIVLLVNCITGGGGVLLIANCIKNDTTPSSTL